ncbi:Leucine rich repeat 4 [Corchorus olitorius]|uniref:Leucine rich repeat 4 n=1 Tax=Corchorus olitorius TaxID=93759 RepID=A0A1R3K7I5_9ROSI|nr:Leucine rich repeat 4 [Corchorus olitorius]
MGWDIVRQESKFPGKRSRLWSPEDVYRVLKNNKGTEAIEGISLNMSHTDVIELSPSIFEKMVNLRIIQFYYSMSGENKESKLLLLNDQDLKSLPEELRYLHWDYCPLKTLPSNFCPEKLVELKLSHCNMEHLWNGDQDLVNLKVIDLKHCKNLMRISNLSQARNIEKLTIGDCSNLAELPFLSHMVSLSSLDVFKCPISKFPEIPTNLTSLVLRKTPIEEVPSSIRRLKRLEYLDMSGTKIQNLPSDIVELDCLDQIDLSGCTNITSFPNVSENVIQLDLDNTGVEEIPSWVSRLKSLSTLNMRDCKNLKSISELPPCLRWLVAQGCTSLKNVSRIDQYQCSSYESKTWQSIIFADCFNLNQDAVDNIVANAMFRSQCIAKQLAEELTEGDYGSEEYKGQVICCFPGSEISDRFEYQSTNSSIIADLGPDKCGRFIAFVICLVVDLKRAHNLSLCVHCEFQLRNKSGDCQDFRINWQWPMYDDESIPLEFSNRVLVLYDSDMLQEAKDYEEASFEFSIGDDYDKISLDDIKVEKCGVHVFYVDGDSSSMRSGNGVQLTLIEDEENEGDDEEEEEPENKRQKTA